MDWCINRNASRALTYLVAMIGIGGMATTTVAAPPALDAKGQKSAYLLGIKCYIANGVAQSDPRYNADGSQSAKMTAKAKQSYNVIYFMGRALGTSDALIVEDIESYSRLMPPAFLRDDAFFQRTRAECIKLGFM
jgi:hypothetical protein